MSDAHSVTRDAGRGLDRAVALAIFGTDAPHAIMAEYDLPYFSTDIACAWEVVEKLQGQHPPDTEDCFPLEGSTWHLHLSHDDEWDNHKMLRNWPKHPQWEAIFDNGCGGAYVYADTAPLAICRAALEATRGHSEPLAGPPQ